MADPDGETSSSSSGGPPGLGQGVDSTGRLADEAIDRVEETSASYREVIDRLGAEAMAAVATSASAMPRTARRSTTR